MSTFQTTKYINNNWIFLLGKTTVVLILNFYNLFTNRKHGNIIVFIPCFCADVQLYYC